MKDDTETPEDNPRDTESPETPDPTPREPEPTQDQRIIHDDPDHIIKRETLTPKPATPKPSPPKKPAPKK